MTNLPPIGARVVRGPDWQWGTQDSTYDLFTGEFTPKSGVVTDHPASLNFPLKVRWSNGNHNVYRYTDRTKDVIPLTTNKPLSDFL